MFLFANFAQKRSPFCRITPYGPITQPLRLSKRHQLILLCKRATHPVLKPLCPRCSMNPVTLFEHLLEHLHPVIQLRYMICHCLEGNLIDLKCHLLDIHLLDLRTRVSHSSGCQLACHCSHQHAPFRPQAWPRRKPWRGPARAQVRAQPWAAKRSRVRNSRPTFSASAGVPAFSSSMMASSPNSLHVVSRM